MLPSHWPNPGLEQALAEMSDKDYEKFQIMKTKLLAGVAILFYSGLAVTFSNGAIQISRDVAAQGHSWSTLGLGAAALLSAGAAGYCVSLFQSNENMFKKAASESTEHEADIPYSVRPVDAPVSHAARDVAP